MPIAFTLLLCIDCNLAWHHNQNHSRKQRNRNMEWINEMLFWIIFLSLMQLSCFIDISLNNNDTTSNDNDNNWKIWCISKRKHLLCTYSVEIKHVNWRETYYFIVYVQKIFQFTEIFIVNNRVFSFTFMHLKTHSWQTQWYQHTPTLFTLLLSSKIYGSEKRRVLSISTQLHIHTSRRE
jgi:hypothetical protein